MLLAQVQEAWIALSKEQLVILADTGDIVNSLPGAYSLTTIPILQPDGIDLYDSDCDDISTVKAIKPTLYDGSVISSQHAIIHVIDDEETLILEESAEQAFWLQTLHPNTDQSATSPVKIKAPRELLKPPSSVVAPMLLAAKQLSVDTTDTPSSTTIVQDVPSVSTSPTTQEIQSLVIRQDLIFKESSSHGVILSNLHQLNQSFDNLSSNLLKKGLQVRGETKKASKRSIKRLITDCCFRKSNKVYRSWFGKFQEVEDKSKEKRLEDVPVVQEFPEEVEDKSEKKRLEDVPIVQDFPEVFPEDLPVTRMASAAAKPYQGDSFEFYLITVGENTCNLNLIWKETRQDCNSTRRLLRYGTQFVETASQFLMMISKCSRDDIRILYDDVQVADSEKPKEDPSLLGRISLPVSLLNSFHQEELPNFKMTSRCSNNIK
nr:hypothetical protein [Tanacetum cinerariifolium]